MSKRPLKVLAVVGSLNRSSATRHVLQHVARELRNRGTEVDVLDLLEEPLALFNPDSAHGAEGFDELKKRVEQADVYILGTPDYHGSISSAMKNFLDHFWHEFAGKLFATIVASYEKGLTVTDQLRTVACQCYAWNRRASRLRRRRGRPHPRESYRADPTSRRQSVCHRMC